MLAFRAILPSDGQPPVRGIMAMGRFLDEDRIKSIGEETHTKFMFYAIEDIPDEDKYIMKEITEKNPIFMKESSKNILSIYSVYEDIYKKPAFLLKVELPKDITIKGRNALNIALFSIFINCFFITLILLIFLKITVIKPLSILTEYIKNIAKNQDLSKSISMKRQDEIGILAGEFDLMIASLNNLLKETGRITDNVLKGNIRERARIELFEGAFKNLCKGLNNILDILLASIEQTGTSVKIITETAEQFTETSEKMNYEIEKTMGHAKLILNSSEETNQSMNSLSIKIDEMNSSIKEISYNSDKASKIAGNAEEYADKSKELVTQLEKHSNEIDEIAVTINDIADQTKLLALNATIEASRAGEAGKGFSVVAEEIKNLANQTAGFTEEINRKIEAIKQDIKLVVTSINQIGKTIQEINQIENTIGSSIREHTVTADDININIIKATRGISDITASINTLSLAINNIFAGATETMAGASALSDIAEKSYKSMEKFNYN